MENQEQNNEIPKGYKSAPSEYFTGKVWLKALVASDEHTNCTISEVVFSPASRNNWHTHPSNQILIVTEGIGYYQEEGAAIREIRTGDVVNVLPGIKHWHGASPDSRFVHLAVNLNTEKGMVNWMERVTDQQYYLKA